MGCHKSRSNREVHSNKCVSQETRKITNNTALHLKKLFNRKRRTKPDVSRIKKIIKVRAKINKIEGVGRSAESNGGKLGATVIEQ